MLPKRRNENLDIIQSIVDIELMCNVDWDVKYKWQSDDVDW